MNGWIIVAGFVLALVLCVTWIVCWAMRDPNLLHRAARAEIDVYRVHRTLEGTQLKHDIRRDERRLRRELLQELEGLDP